MNKHTEFGPLDRTVALADLDEVGASPNETGRTVLGRISSIMKAFDCSDETLALGDLSNRTHLPKSTVHRLAEQLCGEGWIERDCNGYRLGMCMLELGGLALQRNRLRDVAFPHLYSLAGRTELAVQLGVLDGGDVVYLERIFVGGFFLPTRLGGRKPAYCTALGKAMLAYDGEAAEAAALSGMPKRTEHTITDTAAFWSELEDIRVSGVAFDREEAYEGLGCVAAPIRNSGRAIGAVSVTGPVMRMAWDATAEAVRGTALAIWNDRFGAPASSSSRRGQLSLK